MANNTDDINIDIHDRVAEAYYGELGEKLMQETQHRIHWIRDNVMGNKVLDIGCSQGIGPILLGRLGKQVTGVDISQKAVDEANKALEKEESTVKENVHFKKSDFLAYDANKEQFDTITITEVLEHLVNPEDFIEKAKDLLVDNGTLIITVPFGINDHIDHKKTYYFHDLYQMLYRDFDIKDVSILGKWIGFIATKRVDLASQDLEQVNANLIKRMEEAFYSIERELVDNNKGRFEKSDLLQKKLKEANLKYRDALNEMHQMKDELNKKIKKLQAKNIADLQSSSYRLGHLLLHETRSFTDIIKLPKRINDIRKKKRN